MKKEDFLKVKSNEIFEIKKECKEKITKAQLEMMGMAEYFDDYKDLYIFVKKACHTTEEFNEAMLICRPKFLDRKALDKNNKK